MSLKAEMASLLMTKLSSTYLFQTFGGTMELIRAESSITSMQRLATTGLTVINSRFGRFLHGIQETFPHRKRKMLNAYFYIFFLFC